MERHDADSSTDRISFPRRLVRAWRGHSIAVRTAAVALFLLAIMLIVPATINLTSTRSELKLKGEAYAQSVASTAAPRSRSVCPTTSR